MKKLLIGLLIKLSLMSININEDKSTIKNNQPDIWEIEEKNSLKYDLYESVIDGFYDGDTTKIPTNLSKPD